MTGVKEVKCSVQIVDILAMRRSLTLPLDIWSVIVVLILSEAIVMS